MSRIRAQAPQIAFFGIIGLIGLILAGVALTTLFLASIARANPSFNGPTARTAAATTSSTYIVPGVSSSTLTYDTAGICGSNQAVSGNTDIPNQIALNAQFAASSSASVYTMQVEYSNDCIDWYQPVATTSTSIGTFNTGLQNFFSYTFASTTVGGIALTNANSATTTKVFVLTMPYRAIRVVVGLSSTGTRGAFWGELVPMRQVK